MSAGGMRMTYKILVVDDEADIVKLFAEFFGKTAV